jgi:hypothetical protein
MAIQLEKIMTRNEITDAILAALVTVVLIPAAGILLTILWVLVQG